MISHRARLCTAGAFCHKGDEIEVVELAAGLLAGEALGAIQVAGPLAGSFRVGAQRTGASGPWSHRTCRGFNSIGRGSIFDPIDHRTQRIVLIGGRPAGAVIHAGNRKNPYEPGSGAVTRDVDLTPPVDGVVD